MFKQSRAVWAVAFASVIAFMGIGLVDPILPAISADLGATQTQALLLFTSYLFITGIAMLFTSWVSSRIGAKKTLLIGLALIIVFAALAGASNSVEAIIGFRAGWGLGNALFISTALATIVGAASGGVDSAIILYEAALGLGIAVGPLLGGLLGGISWRGPFIGTAVLMAIGFIGIVALLGKPAAKPEPVGITSTFRALRNPALLTLGIAALFYNFGFFILLAYSPFPLELGAQQLGLVFFGWGIGLAITSVFVAPILTRRFGRQKVLYAMMLLLSVDLAVMALDVAARPVLIVCIVVGGLFLGVVNTVLTESVMNATDLPRPVASSAYSAVRFVGGALAPAFAGVIAAAAGAGAPYWLGAAAVLVSIVVLLIGRRAIAHIDADHELVSAEEATVLTAADAS
ncbi:MFS transporter [Saxibacter everestensis]|uniref:MFS transporter n=2 Tax=Saxibacter everestensis TaxID=2909229 RepID=A0ABY8R124_9MICO|nr:MFS transporter [Brevibacteriaceae bacterium ZFBP1038]